jgi:hypothetical protein
VVLFLRGALSWLVLTLAAWAAAVFGFIVAGFVAGVLSLEGKSFDLVALALGGGGTVGFVQSLLLPRRARLIWIGVCILVAGLAVVTSEPSRSRGNSLSFFIEGGLAAFLWVTLVGGFVFHLASSAWARARNRRGAPIQ